MVIQFSLKCPSGPVAELLLVNNTEYVQRTKMNFNEHDVETFV